MDFTNHEQLSRIIRARDRRYDGRIYCGVTTTGIYCRPICPARPKSENLRFFRSAAEAEKAGFRACLRCRPDLAPNSAQWNGTAAIVGRALNLIARGEVNENSLNNLAARLGVSDRHLRRLFEEHVGVSPKEIATSRRLHLARQLLTQSSLKVTDIAFASGYQSIRRFNDAFKEKFKFSPSALRKSARGSAQKKSVKQLAKPSIRENFIHLELPVIAPYRWDQVYGFLESHGIHGIESFVDGKYRRGFFDNGISGAVEISFDPKKSQLTVKADLADPTHLYKLIDRVRNLFDTQTNPHAHLMGFKRTDQIAGFYRRELGLRIPGAWDPFETAVCIVLGQLVSIEQARTKATRLVELFGTEIKNPVFEDCDRQFPTPKILAESSLRDVGLTKVREQAIRELSRLVRDGEIDLSRSADIRKTRGQLLAIKGIGPWTVEMIAMRCLGDTNAFPRNDLIIRRALEQHQNLKGDWSPWNAYITLALWQTYAAALSRKKKK